MARTEKRFVGDVGEEIACRFLERRGFKVLERNYLRPWGEIDIVAQQKDILHFVEVKTLRRSVSHETQPTGRQAGYRPEENVHPQKLKRLHRAVETYLADKRVSHETEWQIDVLTVRLDLGNKKAKLELLENIL